MVFGHLSKIEAVPAQLTLISDYNNWRFSVFIDNYIGAAIFFKAMFNFLYQYYFLYIYFAPVYFTLYKTFIFIDQLDFAGFNGDKKGLRPLIKY